MLVFFVSQQPRLCILDVMMMRASLLVLPDNFGLENVAPLSHVDFILENHFNERYYLRRHDFIFICTRFYTLFTYCAALAMPRLRFIAF